MGKALPISSKFQAAKSGGRAPQSFRSGIVSADRGLLVLRHTQAAANEVADPLRDGASAAQEDAFWHDAYTRESYYVAGRGYDQYRPAYAMGWQAAFDFIGDDFQVLETELERQWEARDTLSLLEWVQVRDAVHAAWSRGRSFLRQDANVVCAERQMSLLRPLKLKLSRFAHELAFLLQRADPPLSEFMRQVLDRHEQLLREALLELPDDEDAERDVLDPFRRIATSMHHGWMVLRSVFRQPDTGSLLEFCERNEAELLTLYRQASAVSLPPELDSVLLRQQRRLQLHQSKLAWVRQHWSE